MAHYALQATFVKSAFSLRTTSPGPNTGKPRPASSPYSSPHQQIQSPRSSIPQALSQPLLLSPSPRPQLPSSSSTSAPASRPPGKHSIVPSRRALHHAHSYLPPAGTCRCRACTARVRMVWRGRLWLHLRGICCSLDRFALGGMNLLLIRRCCLWCCWLACLR